MAVKQLLLEIIFILVGCHVGVSQDSYSFCRPEITQFSRQVYGAYNQTWNISQQQGNRFMYFANSKGLLEFDGSSWRLHELPQKQKVRSVAVDEAGRIYTGALGEFGYWLPDKTGKLTYHSLTALIPDPSFRNEEVWNILVTSQGVLFQSFAYVYRYSRGKVQTLHPPGNVLFVKQVRSQLVLEVIDKGLYELRGDAFVLVKGSEFLGKETVNTLLPAGEKDMLIGTERAIYRYDGQQFRLFNSRINAFMQQNRLNQGLMIGGDRYAFGTLLNGVLVTTSDGRVLYQFNQKNGLQNSTVLSMCQDADGDLWVGLDRGIDLINFNSPIRYFTDHDDNLGTVYDIARHANYLYLGTNQGLYYKPLAAPGSPFQLIPETQGQVWDLTVMDEQLLCGHNRGTFRIDGTKARLICAITGGWVLHRLSRRPDRLIQGTYTKLCIYQKDRLGQWTFSHTVDGFSAPVRQLEEDKTGAIWVNKAPNQGLQRLHLSADLHRIEASSIYIDPVFQQSIINLCQIGDEIMATSARGIRQYQAASNRFVSANTLFPQAEPIIRKLFPLSATELFILRQDGTLSFVRSGSGQFRTETTRELPIRTNQWVEESEAIVPLDTNYIALCRENGFALLPRAELPRLATDSVSAPLIRSIAALDDLAHTLTFQSNQQQGSLPEPSFSHRQADLLITFCTPYYTRPIKYSYWLENSARTWSPYAAIHQKEFSNLPPGQYVLHLRSNLSQAETTLTFEIRPPWYWNPWSKLLYFLLFLALMRVFYQLHLRRVAVKQDQVREKLEEQLRHQEEASQREIILLQKEQLEQGLIQKSEELANSTMSLIQKNELLMQLKDELKQVKNQLGSRMPTDHFQRINVLIDNNMSSEQDWKLFEANFNKVHEQFLKHLIDRYPDLSQGDLKLAAYLRMNLSTKEIAQLLNITHRSVELKRYRLRKKLALDAEINLSEFMIKQ